MYDESAKDLLNVSLHVLVFGSTLQVSAFQSIFSSPQAFRKHYAVCSDSFQRNFQAERDRSHQAIPTPIVTNWYFWPGQYDRQGQGHRQLLHCDLVVPSSGSSSYHHLIPKATLSPRHPYPVSVLPASSQHQPRGKNSKKHPKFIDKDIICIAKQ